MGCLSNTTVLVLPRGFGQPEPSRYLIPRGYGT